MDRTFTIESEQFVIGSLLISNDSIDRIGDLKVEHFYRQEHRTIFSEIMKQIVAGKTCDVITVFEALNDKVADCLTYLNAIAQSTPSAANICRHAAIVVDCAIKRSLDVLGIEIQEMASSSPEDSATIIDRIATKIDSLSEKKTHTSPVRFSETLSGYADVLTARMEGKIRPISTGFKAVDRQLDGGFERGTLTVIAARPGMGKTAAGLALCRNVAKWGSAGFLSMEMDIRQVTDRNIAALGELPVSWLRHPIESDTELWNRLTIACGKAHELNLYIDDETSLNMLEIRNKARQIKRAHGLDMLVIDQLSFITSKSSDKKTYELVGEYTRGMVALAKQMDIAVVLLCQLNRECEARVNKRPQLSDLAMSGSIEQDASNVLFLYRDEIYNQDSNERGICEVICAKQRQGETGTVALRYIAHQTRFDDFPLMWTPPKMREQVRSRGFD